NDPEEFWNDLRQIYIWLLQDKSLQRSKVESVFTYIANACLRTVKNLDSNESIGENIDEQYLIIKLIYLLIENSNAYSSEIKIRIIAAFESLFKFLSSKDVSIEPEIAEKLFYTLAELSLDKNLNVSTRAIKVFTKLQDINDPECLVWKVCKYVLSTTTFSKAQVAVISNIKATKYNFDFLVKYIKSNKPDVKIAVVTFLVDKVNPKILSVEQRVLVLHNLVYSKFPDHIEFCRNKLIPCWISSYNNILSKFFCSLNLIENEKLCIAILNLIEDSLYADLALKEFKTDSLENFNIIGILENISNTEAFSYWFLLSNPCCKHLLIEIEPILKFIITLLDKSKEDNSERMDFAIRYLIEIVLLFDIENNEDYRSLLDNYMVSIFQKNILSPDVCDSFTSIILALYGTNYSALSERILDMIKKELFNQSKDKTTDLSSQNSLASNFDSEIVEIKAELYKLKFNLSDMVDNKDYNNAAAANQNINDLEERLKDLQDQKNNFISQLCNKRLLSKFNIKITNDILLFFRENNSLKIQNYDIEQFFLNTIIIPCLEREEISIRIFAIKCMFIICIKSKAASTQYIQIFFQALKMDCDEVKLEALRSICDLWLFYDSSVLSSVVLNDDTIADGVPETIEPVEETLTSQKDICHVQNYLMSFIFSNNFEFSRVAIFVTSKLFLKGTLKSSESLASLFAFYNYPPDNDIVYLELKSILDDFFSVFSALGIHNKLIMAKILPKFCSLIKFAPSTSPLKQMSNADIAERLTNFTNENFTYNNQSKTDENMTQNRTLNPLQYLETPHGIMNKFCISTILDDPINDICILLVYILKSIKLPDDEQELTKFIGDLEECHAAMKDAEAKIHCRLAHTRAIKHARKLNYKIGLENSSRNPSQKSSQTTRNDSETAVDMIDTIDASQKFYKTQDK
ncbi:MAG: hypothetical protein MHPSP_001598, partial [Paramarteilia canceri]